MTYSSSDLPTIPVQKDAFVDGLLRALSWLDVVYLTACDRTEMEVCDPRDFMVLRMVCRYAAIMRAPTMGELARALGKSMAYVKLRSDELVKETLVERSANPGDRRYHALDATRYGLSCGRVDDLADAIWEILVMELGDDGAADLARGLVHLTQPVVG